MRSLTRLIKFLLIFVLLLSVALLALSCREEPPKYSTNLILSDSGDVVLGFCSDEHIIINYQYNGVKISKIKITPTYKIFHSSIPAKTLVIPYTVTEITEDSLSILNNLESFEVDPDNIYYKSVDGVLYTENGKILVRYPAKKQDEAFVIPDGVTVIDPNAFSGNDYLKEIVIPNSVVTISDGAFANMRGLREIIIPDSVEKIGDEAFSNCIHLEGVELGQNLIKIGKSAFEKCHSLKGIALPDSLKSIGDNAFSLCYMLKDVILPKAIQEIPSGIFASCQNLQYINIPDTVTSIGKSAFASSGLKEIVLPESLEYIGSGCFYNCDSLVEMNLPSGLETIGEAAFGDCELITSITVPESVRTVYNAFKDCINLESITFLGGNILFDGIRDFENCQKLQRINVQSASDWASMEFSSRDYGTPFQYGAKLYIGDEFVTHFEFPEGTKTVNSCIFAQYKWLESIIIPEGVESIEYGAFYGCEQIKEITLPSSLSSLGTSSFAKCIALKTVYLPSVQWLLDLNQNESRLFENVKDLYINGERTTEIVVPDGTVIIKRNTFHMITAITAIYLPSSIKRLEINSIYLCGELDIYYDGTIEEWQRIDEISHYWCNEYEDIYTIHCTNGETKT